MVVLWQLGRNRGGIGVTEAAPERLGRPAFHWRSVFQHRSRGVADICLPSSGRVDLLAAASSGSKPWSQTVHSVEYSGEQRAGNGNLGQLDHHVAAMPDNAGPILMKLSPSVVRPRPGRAAMRPVVAKRLRHRCGE